MKKQFTLAIIAILLLSIFVGCSKNESMPTGTQEIISSSVMGTTDSSEPASSSESKAESEDVLQEKTEEQKEPASHIQSQSSTSAQGSTSSSSSQNVEKPVTQPVTPVVEQTPEPTTPPVVQTTPEPPAPTTPPVVEQPTPPPTPEPAFDVEYWVQFAKNYGVSIGLTLDSSVTGSWDNPITANSKSIYLERDLTGMLSWYKNDYGFESFWVWSQDLGNGNYNIYIGYA